MRKKRAVLRASAEGRKVQLYQMVADSLHDDQLALSVFKRGQSEMRRSFNSDQVVDFRLSTDTFKDHCRMLKDSLQLSEGSRRLGRSLKAEDKSVLRSSMSRCLERSFVPKIDHLRVKILVKAL